MTTTSEITTRLEIINANVTGIVSTSKRWPVSASTARLPLMFSRWMRNDYDYGSSSITFHRYELIVLVEAIAQSTYDAQMANVEAIADSIRDVYAARIHLNNNAGTAMTNIAYAQVESAQNGPPIQIGETYYSTVRAELVVKNISEVTVSG